MDTVAAVQHKLDSVAEKKKDLLHQLSLWDLEERDGTGEKPMLTSSGGRQKENKRQQHAISSETIGTSERSCPSQGNPKKSRISLPLPLQIEQLRIEADRLHVEGQLEQAESTYVSAINLSGPWTERSMHASLHFNYAVCQIKRERYESAIEHASEACKLEPTFPGAHFALGYALAKGGKDIQLSMRSFKQVLNLKPRVRLTLPDGSTFGCKEHPLLSNPDFLFVYRRKSCAHLKIPPNWTTRESRSQPGKIFFENLQTRATTWLVPEEKKKNFTTLKDILAASRVLGLGKKSDGRRAVVRGGILQ